MCWRARPARKHCPQRPDTRPAEIGHPDLRGLTTPSERMSRGRFRLRRHKDPRCQNCTPRGIPPHTDRPLPARRSLSSRARPCPDIICIASQHYRPPIMSMACTLDFPTVPFQWRAGARGAAVAYAGGRGHALAWIACRSQAPVRRHAVRFRAIPNWIAQPGQSNGS